MLAMHSIIIFCFVCQDTYTTVQSLALVRLFYVYVFEIEILLQIKTTIFYFEYILNVIYSCDEKLNFSIFTSVFRVK